MTEKGNTKAIQSGKTKQIHTNSKHFNRSIHMYKWICVWKHI